MDAKIATRSDVLTIYAEGLELGQQLADRRLAGAIAALTRLGAMSWAIDDPFRTGYECALRDVTMAPRSGVGPFNLSLALRRAGVAAGAAFDAGGTVALDRTQLLRVIAQALAGSAGEEFA